MREADPYRALWGAVLISAVKQMDSRIGSERKAAARYIFSSSEHPASFRWICSMLQLNPEKVQTACMSRTARKDLAKRRYTRD